MQDFTIELTDKIAALLVSPAIWENSKLRDDLFGRFSQVVYRKFGVIVYRSSLEDCFAKQKKEKDKLFKATLQIQGLSASVSCGFCEK